MNPDRDKIIPQNPMHNYKFSQEELRVLAECNRDSFYQRCLPYGTILGLTTFYGVKAGYLKPSPRWGATPKVVVAVIVGYFIGKFSYQNKCAEKIMQLPGSQLGEYLRQRRRGGFQESLEPGFGAGMSLPPFGNVSPKDKYTDLEPRNSSLDLDTDRPYQPGLNDSNRPSLDNPVYEEEMPPLQDKRTTYEELRKKNREEFKNSRLGNYKPYPGAQSPSSSQPTAPQVGPEEPQLPRGPINKYGDSWG